MTDRWFRNYRMEWIAESLRIWGYITREHIQRKFGLSVPVASKDLQDFQRLYPNAVTYDSSQKRYLPTQPPKTDRPRYDLCDTVFPSGERCVRPKNHHEWSKAKCSPVSRFMEYCATSQCEEAARREEINEDIKARAKANQTERA